MPAAEVKRIGRETYRQLNDLTHMHTLETYVPASHRLNPLADYLQSLKHMAVFGQAYLPIGGFSHADVLSLNCIHSQCSEVYKGL